MPYKESEPTLEETTSEIPYGDIKTSGRLHAALIHLTRTQPTVCPERTSGGAEIH